MIVLNVQNLRRVKRAVPFIESKIKVKVEAVKPSGRLVINGKQVDCYIVEKVLRAVDFGFDVEDAMLLKSDDFSLEFIDIKEHTHRKNLKEVRARVIGREGKAKNTIEELTGSVIVVNANTVGVIVDSNHVDSCLQGLTSLIQGAKHGNVFAYIEKQNAKLRQIDEDDLGLKEKFAASDVE
ncbi:MAG: hypothetical protein WCP89_02925 [archaeon]